MKPDERLAGKSLEGRCVCGNEPTCIGRYDGKIALGCDGCCGHGNEGGWCVDIVQERHAREVVAAEARGFERAREQAAKLADAEEEHWNGVMEENRNSKGAAGASGMAARLARHIRAMQDERGNGAPPVSMCECGHPHASHDARGCFSWHCGAQRVEPVPLQGAPAMNTHDLKTWPVYFGAVLSGSKTFEARKDDRTPRFEVGDRVMLREWEPIGDGSLPSHYDEDGKLLGRFTGAALERYVTFILRGTEHVAPGYCILALAVEP